MLAVLVALGVSAVFLLGVFIALCRDCGTKRPRIRRVDTATEAELGDVLPFEELRREIHLRKRA